jgi:predicted enzyme related to lactoylglutathione lyase
MSDEQRPPVGTIGWIDLTVPDAEKIKAFYTEVVGWETSPVDMGQYQDFNLIPAGTELPVAGICHARGVNTGLPPQWLMYVIVEDADVSVARCEKLGGKVIVAPKDMGGGGRFSVIQDPAGAVLALFAIAAGEDGE